MSEMWDAAWAGAGNGKLRMMVEVALEAKGGGAAGNRSDVRVKTARVPVNMDAHSKALAHCLIDEALPVSQALRCKCLRESFQPPLSPAHAVVVFQRPRSTCKNKS